MRRVYGYQSEDVGVLYGRRASTLSRMGRFEEARKSALESLTIFEKALGRGVSYGSGLYVLADISFAEKKYEAALKIACDAISYTRENTHVFGELLTMQSNCLEKLERYEEALEKGMHCLSQSIRMNGPEHPDTAIVYHNLAMIYGKLKHFAKSVAMLSQCLAIHKKCLGVTNPETIRIAYTLEMYQRALVDPEMQKNLASKSDRMCSVSGCNIVKKYLNRCMSCLSFYVCKEHEGKINEHVVTCSKFPDLLPDEKKGKAIVKCRRCRKETKLMKCGKCGNVWYCGAQCQKEDWKRHKLFCGKK